MSETGSGESSQWASNKRGIATYIGVCLADLLCAVLLFESVHGWTGSSSNWTDVFAFRGLTNFDTDVVDLIWLTVFRVVMISGLAISAVCISHARPGSLMLTRCFIDVRVISGPCGYAGLHVAATGINSCIIHQ